MKEYKLLDLSGEVAAMEGRVAELAGEGYEWVDSFERDGRRFAVMAREEASPDVEDVVAASRWNSRATSVGHINMPDSPAR